MSSTLNAAHPLAPGSAAPPGCEVYGGKIFMIDARGARIPIELVKAADKLRDDQVRAHMARAEELSAELSAFKQSRFESWDVFLDVLASQYEVKLGGPKGNVTFETIDGCMRIQIAVADRISFGPELQVAKVGVDECLREWGAESRPEIQAIVENAFRVDKEGRLNHGALLSLKRLAITDERWVRAMQAITDSMRVEGSKRYIRFHKRADPQSAWVNVPLDIAAA